MMKTEIERVWSSIQRDYACKAGRKTEHTGVTKNLDASAYTREQTRTVNDGEQKWSAHSNEVRTRVNSINLAGPASGITCKMSKSYQTCTAWSIVLLIRGAGLSPQKSSRYRHEWSGKHPTHTLRRLRLLLSRHWLWLTCKHPTCGSECDWPARDMRRRRGRTLRKKKKFEE